MILALLAVQSFKVGARAEEADTVNTSDIVNYNGHAYAIFEEGEGVGRDKLRPEHFADWVEFAKERNMGLDFNPTFFGVRVEIFCKVKHFLIFLK